jgi:hypothetical protein
MDAIISPFKMKCDSKYFIQYIRNHILTDDLEPEPFIFCMLKNDPPIADPMSLVFLGPEEPLALTRLKCQVKFSLNNFDEEKAIETDFIPISFAYPTTITIPNPLISILTEY